MHTQTATQPVFSISAYLGGHLPLARVFWLYGFIGISALLLLVEYTVAPLKSVLALFTLAYMLAWSIAAWRSANNYRGNTTWRALTYLCVLMPVIGTVLVVGLTAGAPKKQATPVTVQPAVQLESPKARALDGQGMSIDEFLADAPGQK